VSIFFGFTVFILGLFIGSFLNVLIDRLPRGEKITGRSYCENCKKTLSWKDLIPVLSFVYLKGRCRYCHNPLSYQYPLVELLTGILFVFTIYYLPFTNLSTNYLMSSIYYLIIVSSMVVVFFADLKYGIIPDKIIVSTVFVSLAYIIISTFYPLVSNVPLSILNHLLSAVGSFVFFLLIFLITKGKGMGFGDVKLSFLLGLILGFPGVALALYIAFLTGGVVGFILILWKKKSMKFAVPFGPFLVLGALISLFFQDQIITRIMQLF